MRYLPETQDNPFSTPVERILHDIGFICGVLHHSCHVDGHDSEFILVKRREDCEDTCRLYLIDFDKNEPIDISPSQGNPVAAQILAPKLWSYVQNPYVMIPDPFNHPTEFLMVEGGYLRGHQESLVPFSDAPSHSFLAISDIFLHHIDFCLGPYRDKYLRERWEDEISGTLRFEVLRCFGEQKIPTARSIYQKITRSQEACLSPYEIQESLDCALAIAWGVQESELPGLIASQLVSTSEQHPFDFGVFE